MTLITESRVADSRLFTSTTLALRLLLFINHGTPSYVIQPAEVDEDSEDFQHLEAVALILVIEHEILATCYISNAVPLVGVRSEPKTDLNPPDATTAFTNNGHPLHVAVAGNPKSDKESTPYPSVSDMMKATDFWPSIKPDNGEWYLIDKQKPTLTDHAKTVSSYLNDYKSASPEDQEKFARQFFCYLLSACWRKMFNRISSWPAVGFMCQLTSALLLGFVDDVIDKYAWDSLSQEQEEDQTLAREITDNTEALQTLMSFGLASHPEYHSIEALRIAAKSVASGNGSTLYNRSTAKEFHCLLTAVHLGFAKSLYAITMYSGNVEERAQLKGAFCALSIYARMLTYILSSASLVTHLNVFLKVEMLATMVPKSADKRAYQAFATKEVIGFEGKKAESKKAAGKKAAGKKAKEAAGSKAESSKAMPNAQNVPDLPESVDYPESDPDPISLIKWLRTFVSHFLAKRLLEKRIFDFPDQDAVFRIITMHHYSPSFSWSDIKLAISQALSSSPADAEQTVATLKGKIEAFTIAADDRSDKGRAIKLFQKILRNEEAKPAGVHAEMLLWTLGLDRCLDGLKSCDKEFLNLCLAISQNGTVIAVSRLCCPACTQCFKLGGGTPQVRGHHSVLFPVQLTPWFPEDVIQPLLAPFQDSLRDELEQMIAPPVPMKPGRKTGHYNSLSASGLSTGSSTSGGQTAQFRSNGMAGIQMIKVGNASLSAISRRVATGYFRWCFAMVGMKSAAESSTLFARFANTTLLLRLLRLLNEDTPVYQPSEFQVETEVEADDLQRAVASILDIQHEISATCYVSKAATVVVINQTNPDTELDASLKTPLTIQEFWPEVKKDMWFLLNNKEVTLADHAATVASYLVDYKSASPHDQDIYTNQFFSYLLSACWRKMFNRISSWPAVGFMCQLTSALLLGFVDDVIDKYAWDSLSRERGQGDRTLAREITDNAEALQTLMSFGLASHPEYHSIEALRIAAKSVASGNGSTLYNRSTAKEFHCLLTAVHLGFAKSLYAITMYSSNVERAKLEGAFCALSIYARMLTYILSSASLVTHLNVFLKVEMLATMVPKSADKRAYQAFATKEVIGFEGKAVPNEQDDLSLPESVDYAESDPEPLSLIKWLRTLVAHFLARRLLANRSATENFDLRIFSLDHRSPSLSWPDMELAISHTLFLQSISDDAPKVIEVLKAQIEARRIGQGDKFKLLKTFQNIINVHNSIPTVSHCRVITVSLGLDQCWNEFESGFPELPKLCQKISQHKNPKPCCPVCWEFGNAAKSKRQAPVRCGHLTPSMWLLRNIIEQRVTLLQDRLRDELRRMMINITSPPLPVTTTKKQRHYNALGSSISRGQTPQFRRNGMAGIEFLRRQ